MNAKKKQVPNKGRKTTAKKTRAGVKAKNSPRKNQRKEDVRKKVKLPQTKPYSKSSSKHKVQTNKKSGATSRKGAKQKPKSNRSKATGNLIVSKQTRKTGKQLDFSFKGVRKADKKIDLFNEQSDKALKKQLAKHGGKPPRGIVLVVTDKNGKEAAAVSPLDFVVNKENVKKFTTKFLKELQKDNQELNRIRRKKKATSSEVMKELLAESEENYGNYDPDNISDISIKFIY